MYRRPTRSTPATRALLATTPIACMIKDRNADHSPYAVVSIAKDVRVTTTEDVRSRLENRNKRWVSSPSSVSSSAHCTIAVAGIGTAWAIYHRRLISADDIRKTAFPIAAVLERKFFLDDLYERAFAINIFQRGWNRLVEQFDTLAVDGSVNGVGWVGQQSSRVLRHAQTGQVQLYGAGIAAGVFIVAIIVFIANPL